VGEAKPHFVRSRRPQNNVSRHCGRFCNGTTYVLGLALLIIGPYAAITGIKAGAAE